MTDEKDARICARLTADPFIMHGPWTFIEKLVRECLFNNIQGQQEEMHHII
jgi:hypothetical protein